jgi:hypothetical protein
MSFLTALSCRILPLLPHLENLRAFQRPGDLIHAGLETDEIERLDFSPDYLSGTSEMPQPL